MSFERDWCINCRYSSEKVEVTEEELNNYLKEYTGLTEEQLESSGYSSYIDMLKDMSLPYKNLDEFIEYHVNIMNAMKNTYPYVIWCKKLLAVLVANPSSPAQWENKREKCEYFMER